MEGIIFYCHCIDHPEAQKRLERIKKTSGMPVIVTEMDLDKDIHFGDSWMGNGIFPILKAAKTLDWDFVWVIEYDVEYTGDWKDVLVHQEGTDFVFQNEPEINDHSWFWNNNANAHCLFNIYGMSRKAINILDQELTGEMHYEQDVTEHILKHTELKYEILAPKEKRLDYAHIQPTLKNDVLQHPVKLEVPFEDLYAAPSGFICICALAKNEDRYLSEWIEWHKNKKGIDNIILVSNDDTPHENMDGVHVVNSWVGKPMSTILQADIYTWAYRLIETKWKWFIALDIDEFLECDDLEKFLENKEGRIRLNWKCFDDNDLIEYEPRPVKERFTRVLSEKTQQVKRDLGSVKTLVQTGDKTAVYYNAHDVFGSSLPAYNSTGERVFTCEYTSGKSREYKDCYISHYITKSLQEWVEFRMGRPFGDSEIRNRIAWFFMYCPRTKKKLNWIKKHIKDL